MRTASHIKNVRHWESIEYKLTYYKDFDFFKLSIYRFKIQNEKGQIFL